MNQSARGTLQTATVIAKTTETIVGQEISVGGYSFITLFFSYVNGDETGLNIYPYFMQATGGTAHQDQDWTSAAGTRTPTANQYQLTATGSHMITFDVRGIQFIKFMQGGSANDGTPTGTLAASYTMTAGG